jgi:hypothetical protein
MWKVEKKQSVTLAATVLTFCFLGYQIYKLVRDDVVLTPMATPSEMILTPPQANASVEQHPVVVAPAPKVKKLNTSYSLSPDQQQYVEIANQYQLAKMKRQLLDEQASVAEEVQRIAEIKAKTRQLQGSTDDALSNDNSTYQLSYVDQKNGQWSATLIKEGQYQEVTIGTLLSDGMKVAAIRAGGVLLQKGSQEEWVTFNGLVAAVQKPVIVHADTPIKPSLPPEAHYTAPKVCPLPYANTNPLFHLLGPVAFG